MPKFLERKLKAEYGANSKIPYKIMNVEGYMHGNKETAKGKAVERKHAADQAKGKAAGPHPHKNLGKYLHPSKRGRKPTPGGY